jgi:predicted KAP-like P-loop ATPase
MTVETVGHLQHQALEFSNRASSLESDVKELTEILARQESRLCALEDRLVWTGQEKRLTRVVAAEHEIPPADQARR